MEGRISKRDAVTRAGLPATLENDSKLVPAARVIQQRMNAHAVEENRRTPTLVNRDVQSANHSRAIVKRTVRNTNVRAIGSLV